MSDEENAALLIKTGIEQMFVPLHHPVVASKRDPYSDLKTI